MLFLLFIIFRKNETKQQQQQQQMLLKGGGGGVVVVMVGGGGGWVAIPQPLPWIRLCLYLQQKPQLSAVKFSQLWAILFYKTKISILFCP